MNSTVEDRIESHFDRYEIVRQLHGVPPHEVYEISIEDRRAIYKGDTGPTGRAGIEGRIISFVGDRTSVPVPEILCIGTDYYIAAWHPDAPHPQETYQTDSEWAAAAGRGLATLHEETATEIDSYGQFVVQDDRLTVSGYDDWHAAAIEYVQKYRPTLGQYGHADMADAVIEFFANRPDVFAGCGGAVCCHGWATPEHVAVADGQVVCMVDFEHALAAPGEFDYWRTLVPTFGPAETNDARKKFRAGYESIRPLQDEFDRRRPLYGLLNGIYFFESLYVQDQHSPEEEAERAAAYRERIYDTIDSLE